jgi:hypothetical protein
MSILSKFSWRRQLTRAGEAESDDRGTNSVSNCAWVSPNLSLMVNLIATIATTIKEHNVRPIQSLRITTSMAPTHAGLPDVVDGIAKDPQWPASLVLLKQ